MAKRRQEETTAGEASHQALATLLATEAQLDARLAAARADAQRILADGTESAHRATAGGAALIAERSAALDTEIAKDLQRELAAIEDAAQRAVSRYAAIVPARAPDLVALVVARVLSGDRPAGVEPVP